MGVGLFTLVCHNKEGCTNDLGMGWQGVWGGARVCVCMHSAIAMKSEHSLGCDGKRRCHGDRLCTYSCNQSVPLQALISGVYSKEYK